METSSARDQLYQLPACSYPTNENEETVITGTKPVSPEFANITDGSVAIRATDVTLGLRRLPAGFYVVLHHNGLEWRTENKPSSVNHDVVEWSGPIPM